MPAVGVIEPGSTRTAEPVASNPLLEESTGVVVLIPARSSIQTVPSALPTKVTTIDVLAPAVTTPDQISARPLTAFVTVFRDVNVVTPAPAILSTATACDDTPMMTVLPVVVGEMAMVAVVPLKLLLFAC